MSRNLNMRKAYGEELVAIGAENQNVVVLEADLGKSTMSIFFQQAYPERFFEMGIAEQDMVSTAAGLAAAGKIPFCSTFAVFMSGRAYDQIRQTVAIGRLNVKLCGSSAGLSDFGDGSTHQAVEDVALMCAIPGMTVLTPCDAADTRRAVRAALNIDGPVYIRVVRNDLPDYTSEAGAALNNIRVIREGGDVAVFAHGSMVSKAVEAAELLSSQGISAKVVSITVMKPFPQNEVLNIAKSVKAVVTAEDHTYIGGLAASVALTLRKSSVPLDYVAIDDVFGQSAHSVEELMVHYGLTAEHIAEKAVSLLKNR